MGLTIHLPLTLTLMRLVAAPCTLPFLIVALSPANTSIGNGFLAAYFFFFGMTDFFDGYYARKFRQVTVLGSILDPLADKFLMYSTLVALLVVGKIQYYWVLIFIGREFFVMGLRHIACEHQYALPVSWTAKIKTVFQFLYITVALLNPYSPSAWCIAPYWNGIEALLLMLAILLSLYSAWQYYRAVFSAYHAHRRT
jgi:CDP-diacylglycerol--glycerol-3-phosphate 3-phosphatidyltransferase